MQQMFTYIVCMCFSAYCLEALNIEKFIKKNRVTQAYGLHLLLMLCLAYILSNFLLDIANIRW